MVQEISGKFRDKKVWKLPTGVVNEVSGNIESVLAANNTKIKHPYFMFQGEDIWTTAIREVKEETGVSCQVSILVTAH